MANSFISEFGRKYNRTNHGFTCTDYVTAMCCWTSAMPERRNFTVGHYKSINKSYCPANNLKERHVANKRIWIF